MKKTMELDFAYKSFNLQYLPALAAESLHEKWENNPISSIVKGN